MPCDFSFLKAIDFEPLDNPLTPEEIAEFEKMNEIVLPDDYREFLMTIGNGIKINLGKRDQRYISGIRRPVNKRYNWRLKLEFPFKEPYHDRLGTHNFEIPEDCPDPKCEEEDSCLRCLHLDTCFYAYSDKLDSLDNMIYNGTHFVCYAGCTYSYFLIISGERRGEVWINNESDDFAPTKPSFAAFLEWAATADYI